MQPKPNEPAVPYHLGIIPDGNRRWAREQGVTTLQGHRRGADNFRVIARAAFDAGVKVVTVFAFSTENWRRTEEEVGYLMELFYGLIVNEFDEFAQRSVRFRVAGDRDSLSKRLVKAIDELEARTADFTNGTFVLCLNYGGQQELAHAAAALITAGVVAEDVTPERLARELYVPEVPPIDLVIRSSREQRLSGFMPWQTTYAELVFVDQYWPAFTVDDLTNILAQYADRERRFGK